MRQDQYTVTPATVQSHAADLLQTHLQLPDHGPKCRAGVLLTILFAAAARVSSLFDTCQRLRYAPSDEAVRQALRAGLPALVELERRLNGALGGDLPKALRRRRQPLAFDLTLIPYHGQPQQTEQEIYRSQAKHGTSYFHAYATAYVVRKGRRFTVALTAVSRAEPLDAVLRRLLQVAAQAGIRPRCLLLDRGFYSVGVIRYLQAARYPFLMPAVCRGRALDDPRGPSGTNVFRAQTHSGWFRYTLSDAHKQPATVDICVKCRNYRGQWQRHGRQTLVYAYWGWQPQSYDQVRQLYRTRFGIETSYRQLHQARIRTTTRSPLLRLLFVGVAVLLRNVWVWFHWVVFATPRRGGRQLQLSCLRFKTLLQWLLHLAEAALGTWDVAYAECRP